MATSALVLRQNLAGFSIVSDYYRLCKREPTIQGSMPVDQTQSFSNTFKHLVEYMNSSKRTNFVVVAHGIPDVGLIMAMAPETKVSAGYCLPDLVKIVDQLDATDGKSADANFLKARSNDWAMKESTILSIAKTCRAIRWSDSTATTVHIRGCDIGKQTSHLRATQRLFRSARVSAPKCGMFYVNVNPSLTDGETYARSHSVVGRRWLYPAGTGRSSLLLDIQYDGDKSRSQSATAKSADVAAWARFMLENPNVVSSTRSFPLAGLYPPGDDSYWLAHEGGYKSYLAEVTD
jgi:hypothetical protein